MYVTPAGAGDRGVDVARQREVEHDQRAAEPRAPIVVGVQHQSGRTGAS